MRWMILASALLSACGCGGSSGDPVDAGVEPDVEVTPMVDAGPVPDPELFIDIDMIQLSGALVPSAGAGVGSWCNGNGELRFTSASGDTGLLGVPSCAGNRASFSGLAPRGISGGRWLSQGSPRIEGPLLAFGPLQTDQANLTLTFGQVSHRVTGQLLLNGAPFPLNCAAPKFQLESVQGQAIPLTCNGAGAPSFDLRLPAGSYAFWARNSGQFADAPLSWTLDPVVVDRDLGNLVVDVRLLPVSGTLVESGASVACTTGIATSLRWSREQDFTVPVNCAGSPPSFAARMPPGRYAVAPVVSDLAAPATTIDLGAAMAGLSVPVTWVDLDVQVTGTALGAPCTVTLREADDRLLARLPGDCGTGSYARRVLAGRYARVVLEGDRERVLLGSDTQVSASATLPFNLGTVRFNGSLASVDSGSGWRGCMRVGLEPPKYWDVTLTEAAGATVRRLQLPCAPLLPAPFSVDLPPGSYRVMLKVPSWDVPVPVPGLVNATTGPVSWSHTLTWRSAVFGVRRIGTGQLTCPIGATLGLLPTGGDPTATRAGASFVGCPPGQTSPLVFQTTTLLAGEYQATILFRNDDGNGESTFARPFTVPSL